MAEFKKYKDLKFVSMVDWIAENHPEDLEWFLKASKTINTEKKKVYVLDENGEKIPTGQTTKSGKPKYKYKFEEIEGGKQTEAIDIIEAKKAFCKKYFPDLLPKDKKEESSIDYITRKINEYKNAKKK